MKKPKIYKQGDTPKQAYTVMQWMSKQPIVLDDTLIIRREA